MQSKLIQKDSFIDDFRPKMITRSFSTMKPSQAEKDSQKEKDAKKKKGPKDPEISLKAKNLLWKFLLKESPLLILGFPFMFAGSLADFMIPHYVGLIINDLKDGKMSYEEGGVNRKLVEWIVIVVVGSLCAFLREFIFGVTSERLGTSLRQALFESIINKDVSFFDDMRTGDILSRLASDTQVVQDGLTTNVAMFVKALSIMVGSLVILFLIDWRIGLITVLILVPQLISTRLSGHLLNAFSEKYQSAKALMSNIATENLQNIRTVKAFADEDMCSTKF